MSAVTFSFSVSGSLSEASACVRRSASTREAASSSSIRVSGILWVRTSETWVVPPGVVNVRLAMFSTAHLF
ncbi:MAG: hypothetical protein ACRDLQ_04755 [Solirubrobacterales bacterium]